ncbi:MAG: chromosome segregation protein SMC [Firmicutes bacterium]|nr:chromosome segregation protein SMC [Bacillota bacterium]
MYLKSLTLRGFKSFADRTVIRFEPGVTSIVGPNGSGKSNISDAVMWVLGEQSARSLRSGSMDDVIFAGSAARPALGMAEVSLTLSNTDGLLPIEFSEVTITRRLFRSGESDYYINNSPCRLLDIQELLLDSGLGKGLYSIIGQGRLEEVLNSKPEDKRLLIEEAAGILKHKKRKERAVKRLASMDQNLQRAKDIVQEISRQLKPLKNQAIKAQEYVTLTDRLKTLEVGLAITHLHKLQDDWQNVITLESELREKLSDLKTQLSDMHDGYEKLQVEFEAKNFYSGDINEKRRRLQSAEERIRSNIDLLAEKQKNIEQRISEAKHNISQAEQRKAGLAEQRDWLSKEKASLQENLKNNASSLASLEQEMEETKAKRLELEENINRLKAKIQNESNIAESYQVELHGLQLAVQTNENQLNFLREEYDKTTKKKNELYQKLEQKKRDAELVGIELTKLEFQFNELNMLTEQLKRELEDIRKRDSELKQEFAGIKARIKALEDIIDSFPSLDDITNALDIVDMQEFLGLLKDAIAVKPEFERAIEAALGGDIFCVVLENSNNLKKLANERHKDSLGMASFIASDRARFSLPSAKLPFTTWALDVVSYPDKFKYAVSALLSHVYIVSDFNTALLLQDKVENEVLVTLSGEVILPNGKVIFGAANESVGILGYQRELQELNSKLNDLEDEIEASKKIQADIEMRLESFNVQKDDFWTRLQARKVEQKNIRQTISDIEPELSLEISHEKLVREKILKLEAKLKEDMDSISRLKQESKAQRDKLYTLQYNLDEATKKREIYHEEESRLRVEIEKLKVDIESLNERLLHNTRRSLRANNELKDFDLHVDEKRAFLDFLENLNEKFGPFKVVLQDILKSIAFRQEQVIEMTSFEEGSLEDLRNLLRQHQLDINKINDQIESTIKQIHETEVRKAQLELKVTSAVQKVVDEYGIPLEKALDYRITIPDEEAEAEISSLRKRIAALGPVNPVAVEEYNQLEERHKFFVDQIEDLQRSRRALMKVISAIEQKMKIRFSETFEKVNENFQKVFEALFPGGQAELILTDPEDIKNSGIDIVAQPGGKKLQRLSLLSGGEKSLVALAFSFALYQTRPSPFYILDEVEAALDDINLQRFITLINKLKQKSQVLIITHQRRTMEIADSLYGVSMQADGVSKLISQKFSEVTIGVG